MIKFITQLFLYSVGLIFALASLTFALLKSGYFTQEGLVAAMIALPLVYYSTIYLYNKTFDGISWALHTAVGLLSIRFNKPLPRTDTMLSESFYIDFGAVERS